MTDEQDMIRKISALLKKAEGTDNENEAASFFAKANELMLKHSIDEARVRAEARARGEATDDPVQVYWMWATHDAHAKAKETLIAAIARSQHVRFTNFANKPLSNIYREGNEGKYSQWGSLVGFPQDVENVKVLYASLLIQWTRFIRQDVKAWRATPQPERMWYDDPPVKEYGFKTGHLEGFAIRVGQRLREQVNEVVTAANANAVMVLKDQMIADWVTKKNGPVFEYCLARQPQEQLPRKNSVPRLCISRKGHDPIPGTIDGHAYTWKPVYTSGRVRRDVDETGYRAGEAAGSIADISRPSTKIGR